MRVVKKIDEIGLSKEQLSCVVDHLAAWEASAGVLYEALNALRVALQNDQHLFYKSAYISIMLEQLLRGIGDARMTASTAINRSDGAEPEQQLGKYLH